MCRKEHVTEIWVFPMGNTKEDWVIDLWKLVINCSHMFLADLGLFGTPCRIVSCCPCSEPRNWTSGNSPFPLFYDYVKQWNVFTLAVLLVCKSVYSLSDCLKEVFSLTNGEGWSCSVFIYVWTSGLKQFDISTVLNEM